MRHHHQERKKRIVVSLNRCQLEEFLFSRGSRGRVKHKTTTIDNPEGLQEEREGEGERARHVHFVLLYSEVL